MQTLFEKLNTYVRTYHKSANVITYGFCQWGISGTRNQKASIAKKAIKLGMKINTREEQTPQGEPVSVLVVSY